MALSRYVLVVLGVTATFQAWGQQPADAAKPPSEAPAPATATAPNAAAPAGATPAPATPTQASATPPSTPNAASPGLSPNLILRAKNLGLSPKTRGNVTVYCKKDVPVGTRFPVETCYHEDELQQQVAILEYRKDQMKRGSNQ
jgi:hypothetical protein